MKLKNVFLGIFASTLLLASCSNDDAVEKDVPLGTYDNGVLVLNEGNFGTPNASVTYISNDFNVLTQNIFGIENNDKKLGDVAQSISFSDACMHVFISTASASVSACSLDSTFSSSAFFVL